MSKKKKKGGGGGFGGGRRLPAKLSSPSELQGASIDDIPAGPQRAAVDQLMSRYPKGSLHTSEGEFVWRAPAEEFAMIRFFVNSAGMIDIRPEVRFGAA